MLRSFLKTSLGGGGTQVEAYTPGANSREYPVVDLQPGREVLALEGGAPTWQVWGSCLQPHTDLPWMDKAPRS